MQGSNIIKVFYKGVLLFEFIDIIKNEDSFTRHIQNTTIYYHNKCPTLITSLQAARILKNIKPSKEINMKILTMDIETLTINNIKTPYCISIFDGDKA
jgi:hypothetical protein